MSVISFSGVSSYRQIQQRQRIEPAVVEEMRSAIHQDRHSAIRLLESTISALPPMAPGQRGILVDIYG